MVCTINCEEWREKEKEMREERKEEWSGAKREKRGEMNK
jgi:hypothetical protein